MRLLIKNAYRGYENSEEYASDYRSAMEKVFTWQQERQKRFLTSLLSLLKSSWKLPLIPTQIQRATNFNKRIFSKYIQPLQTGRNKIEVKFLWFSG